MFTLADFRSALRGVSDSAAYKRLRYLESVGKVVSVVRGVYAVLAPGQSSDRANPDPFLLLRAMRSDAVFCGHSALELHGVAHQFWNRTTAYSEGSPVAFTALQQEFATFAPPGGELLTTTFDRRGFSIRVTSPETTLVEGFRYPQRVGGIEEFVRSAQGFHKLDLSRLDRLLQSANRRKLYAAVGWFLASNPQTWKVDDEFLLSLQAQRPKAAVYLERNSRGGVLKKVWNLIIPRELVSLEVDELI